MENNITIFFEDLLEQCGSYDIALSEFKRQIGEEPSLRAEYRQWCEENGYSERIGFEEFCELHMSSHNSIMDSLYDYDE
jgi:hypothetical protein